jgi:nitroreductase
MDYEKFLTLCEKRGSCRSYSNREVPDELINKCLECARLAPSACNKQPWRFSVVKDEKLRNQIASTALLPALPMPWFKDAPVIIALSVEKSFVTHTLAPLLSGLNYQLIDAGIAGEHLVLAAESLNLGTCWIGWFNEKRIKKILKLPGKLRVVSLFTLGFPNDKYYSHTPSSRKNLDEILIPYKP